MRELPTGTVTFLFTDIEGSTRLLQRLGAEAYGAALSEHRRLLRNVFTEHRGVEIDTQGDAFFVAFSDASYALSAAQEGQSVLASGPIRVRMGLHSGTPHVNDGGYVGEDVHLGARIAASGHGGQILMSRQARELVDATFLDLGEHRVKDFGAPVWIYQVGTDRFPPLKTISNTNLPRPASTFVGRKLQVTEIVALLSNSERLVTLTGPGGSGKTRLAIESAVQLVPEFKNGVFWVGLANLRDAALVPDSIGQTIGAKDGLTDHIGEREMLLVLDNLEQVVEAAPGLAALVESCPNLRLLVTSRERLRVRGETEYSVPPLADPEAIELFSTRSQLAPGDTIAELCRRLDNLPLAVELAAARTSVLSPAQILERLSRRFDVLKGGRDVDPRQQTLRATIEWSHDLLTDGEKALFARLSVFGGGCTLEAAEEIADADIDNLQSLVDKSLVRHTDERFWMLKTIRDYALERLVASGAEDSVRRRHAEFFLASSLEAEKKLRGAEAEPWLDMLEANLENVRAALDYFESTGDIEAAMRMAGALTELWDQRAHHPEALRRLTRLLGADRQPSAGRAAALDGGANMALMVGDPETAWRWEEEALESYRQLGDARGTASALWGLGYMSIEKGDYSKAEALLRETVRILGELGDDTGLAWATRTLAFTYFRLGDQDGARPLYEESLRRARDVGDPVLQAHALGVLSEYAIDEGRDLDAAFLAHQSLQLVAATSDPLLVATRLCSVAKVLCSLGRPVVAAQLISHAEAQQEEIGAREPWVALESEQTLAAIHEVLDDAAFTEASELGRRMSPEAAVSLADTELESAIVGNRAS